jgi:hypothetical protein
MACFDLNIFVLEVMNNVIINFNGHSTCEKLWIQPHHTSKNTYIPLKKRPFNFVVRLIKVNFRDHAVMVTQKMNYEFKIFYF